MVNLESILVFVSGTNEEPVMGFPSPLSIIFTELRGSTPTASTCTRDLYLPTNTLSQEEQFNQFDLAFVNTYFGLV